MKKNTYQVKSIVTYADTRYQQRSTHRSSFTKKPLVTSEEECSYLGKLPGLRGTEKQVSWGIKLRTDALQSINGVYFTVRKQYESCNDEQDEHILLQILEGYHWCFQESHITAEWWINNRPENLFNRYPHWREVIHTEIERHLQQMEPSYSIVYTAKGWSYDLVVDW